MKKYLSILMIAVLAVFASCSNDDDDKTVYTVTFETDGGTPVPSAQRVEEGSTATAPSTNPAKAGYAFVFWHLSGATTAYNFQTPVSSNITLQAKWQEEGGLAAVAAELGENADYSMFATALADVSAESGYYTVFALPDSIIKRDTDIMPTTDIQWHAVYGKYTAEELLKAQTLQTVGGQILTVVRETVEIAGEEQDFLYINDVPVDYQSVHLMGGSTVYPIGTNIARISNAPDKDDLDAYNNWAVLAIEGAWEIERIENRKYHVWSVSGREKEPFERQEDKAHVGCREVFERNPANVSLGCAGTYKTIHRCGNTEMSYSTGGVHLAEGWWWSVDANRIEFRWEMWVGGPIVARDWFNFTNGIGRVIKCASGYGGDRYYGGDENVIFDTYYETEYTLRKIPNW